MTENEAWQEMRAGYADGLDENSPQPSDNRSDSYKHGWMNGRDDLAGEPRANAQELREAAAVAIIRDTGRST